MTLPPTPWNATPERRRASDLLKRAQDDAEAVRRRNLSEEGKSRELARIWNNTRERQKLLREAESLRLAQQEAKAEARLFHASGRSADAISVRDADDRAEQVAKDPAALSRLMAKAVGNGDRVLEAACAKAALAGVRAGLASGDRRRAVQFDGLLETYVGNHPELQSDFDELAEAHVLANNRPPFAFSPGPKPTECSYADLAEAGVEDSVARIVAAGYADAVAPPEGKTDPEPPSYLSRG